MIIRLLLFLFMLPAIANANLNTIYLAGGCFWCVEEVYEKLNGVIDVRSGYSGGHVENPTYKEVVMGDTGHIEVAEIVFDSDIVSLDTIIRTFFVNIDPFDGAGQFCDKGYSYKSALLSNDQIVIDRFNFYIDKIQENHNQKVETLILPFNNFYVAEEYHQDYYKKNPIRYTYYKYSCGREQRIKQLKINLG